MPTQIPIRWYPIAAGRHASFSRSNLEVPVFTLGGDIGQNVYELRRDMQQFSLTTYKLGRVDVTGFIRHRLTGLYEYSLRRSNFGTRREPQFGITSPFGITRERDGVFYGITRSGGLHLTPSSDWDNPIVYDEHGIAHGRIPDVTIEGFELGFAYSFADLTPGFPTTQPGPLEGEELSELGLPSFIIPENEPFEPAPQPEIYRPTRFERKPVI